MGRSQGRAFLISPGPAEQWQCSKLSCAPPHRRSSSRCFRFSSAQRLSMRGLSWCHLLILHNLLTGQAWVLIAKAQDSVARRKLTPRVANSSSRWPWSPPSRSRRLIEGFPQRPRPAADAPPTRVHLPARRVPAGDDGHRVSPPPPPLDGTLAGIRSIEWESPASFPPHQATRHRWRRWCRVAAAHDGVHQGFLEIDRIQHLPQYVAERDQDPPSGGWPICCPGARPRLRLRRREGARQRSCPPPICTISR